MKRLAPLLIFGALLLVSCAKKSDLPPEEVLRRSAQSVDQLQSARFTLNGDLSTPSGTNFSAKANGVLQQGGKQFQFAVTFHGTYPQAGVNHTIDAEADIAVAGENDVYMRIRSFSMSPTADASSLQEMGDILNQWWKLPAKSEGGMQDVAPEPKLLQMQSQVIAVTQDLGLQNIDGREAYRYKVTLDPVKFMAFLQASAAERGEPFNPDLAQTLAGLFSGTGELWVDHDLMFVRRLAWEFTSKEASLPLSAHLSVDLSDYNNAAPIPFPQDAKPWTFGSVIDTKSSPLLQNLPAPSEGVKGSSGTRSSKK